jgi:glycosyltransferase involved in cell wall biosynthesis
MRILQIDKQRGWAGQIQQTFLTAKGLHQRGHKVLLVCQPNTKIGKNAAAVGIDVMYLSMGGLKLFTSAIKLGLYLIKEKYVILHAHGARDHLLTILARLISRKGRVLRTKHNVNPVKNGLLQYHYLTHKLSGVSKAACASLEEAGIPKDKISLIYSAFDISAFFPQEPSPSTLKDLNINKDDLIIGSMGRLKAPNKGMKILLQAAPIILEKIPNARFLLAGKPSEDLTQLANDLGIAGRVIFPGFRNDVPQILSCTDIYVQPSFKEALGSSIIQAMAMGKPVVASNTGGIPELVKDNETGFLFEPKNPEALAQAVLKLAKNETGRLKMGSLGRKRILESFTLDRMIDEIEGWYQDALNV